MVTASLHDEVRLVVHCPVEAPRQQVASQAEQGQPLEPAQLLLEQTLGDLKFDTPLALSAGFDKVGKSVDG